MLRIFADHCVGYSFVRTLRENACDVTLLKDHLPIESDDAIVIEKAHEDYLHRLFVLDSQKIRIRQ